MKIFQSGAGPTVEETTWQMDRRSGEVQQISFWIMPSGSPSAPVGITLLAAGAAAAAPVYSATPTVPTLLVLEVNGPFTIICSSTTTAAGSYSVWAQ